jgi:hypothetical protein
MRDLRSRCGGNDDHHDSNDKASAIGVGSNPVFPRDQGFKCRDNATILASCAAVQQHNSKEGTRSLSEIPCRLVTQFNRLLPTPLTMAQKYLRTPNASDKELRLMLAATKKAIQTQPSNPFPKIQW